MPLNSVSARVGCMESEQLRKANASGGRCLRAGILLNLMTEEVVFENLAA